MARNKEEGISGMIGNVVFYTMNGRRYARSRPTVTKKRKKELSQSPAVKVFSVVSKAGSAMLVTLQEYLLFPFTLATYNTARGWMRNQYAPNQEEAVWALSAKYGTACQLNIAADLREILQAGIQVTDAGKGSVSVSIDGLNPVKQIKAPAGTKAVNIKLLVVSAPFHNSNSMQESAMEQYTIPYKNAPQPAKETVVKVKGKKGDIAIVVIALEFEMTGGQLKKYNRDSRYLPAAIVAMGKLKG